MNRQSTDGWIFSGFAGCAASDSLSASPLKDDERLRLPPTPTFQQPPAPFLMLVRKALGEGVTPCGSGTLTVRRIR